MLEANPSGPEEETLAQLEKVLGRSRRDDGEVVRLRSECTQGSLQLSAGAA